jgi:hypothetical protein
MIQIDKILQVMYVRVPHTVGLFDKNSFNLSRDIFKAVNCALYTMGHFSLPRARCSVKSVSR